MRLKPSPTQEIALFLTVYAGLAIAFNAQTIDGSWNLNLLWHALTTVGLAWALSKLIEALTHKKRNVSNAITSGWILFLILHPPTEPTWLNLLPGILSTVSLMGFKTLIQFKKMPILNPVVGGLLAVALLAHFIPGINDPFVSWWGASFRGSISLALILIWMVFGLRKWRKSRIVLSFLSVYILLLVAFKVDSETINFIMKDATLYFMAAIMLVEPKTSPLTAPKQVVYGGVAGLGMALFTVHGWAYFDLITIALANGFNLGFKILPMLRQKMKS